MKTIHFITLFNRMGSVLFLLGILVLGTSCESKAPFLSSSVLPAARGYVTVKKDNNENQRIQLHLDYLAEATRLQPSRKTYVVWMVTKEDMTKNIGQINSSNNLKATFETVTSFEPVRIFITAEDDGTVSYPGSQMVLTTDRLRHR
jgi:hypothetical protein